MISASNFGISCWWNIFINPISIGNNSAIAWAVNGVVINGEVKILICHMQKNSIQPQKGDTVKTGDVIGLVGNTGFSIEPHLHIQAYQTFNGVNKMVPMRFNGRFLNMNDIIYTDN